MADQVWGGDRFEYDEGSTGILINGTVIPTAPGSSFRDTIKNVTLDAGFGKYRVFLNGAEIRPSEAPEMINEGDRIEVRPYDVAGKR